MRAQPTWIKWAIGIVSSSFFAWYIPLIAAAMLGSWADNISRWALNGAVMLVLMVQNVAGMAIKRPNLVGWVLAGFWFCFWLWAVVTTERLRDWRAWWVVLVVPPIASGLNEIGRASCRERV